MSPRLAQAGSLHRGRAQTATIAAQSLALVLLAGTVYVAIMGLPTVRTLSSAIPEPPPIREVGGAGSVEPEAPDFPPLEALVLSLESLPNAPKKDEESTVGDEVLGTQPLTGGNGEITFLGGVLSSSRSLAVLKIGEKKYWAPEGGQLTLDDGRSLRVVRVGNADALIEVDGQDRRLERAARTGSAVARLSKSESDLRRNLGGPMGNRLGMQGMNGQQDMNGQQGEEIVDPVQRRIRQLTEQAVEIQGRDPQRAQQIRNQIEALEQQAEMRRERAAQISSPTGTAAGADDATSGGAAGGSDDR